ncbi:MAG: ATP-binding protein [Bacteroidota bacterium]
MVFTITGAESTGKTTLSEQLARELNGLYIPEYSREYLSARNGRYEESDLLDIARGQTELERSAMTQEPPCLICDTSMLVLYVWSKYKYGRCEPWIERMLEERRCDLYILPHFDIPYEPDPLRENPSDRDVLFRYYQQELSYRQLPHIIVHGSSAERQKTALEACLRIM